MTPLSLFTVCFLVKWGAILTSPKKCHEFPTCCGWKGTVWIVKSPLGQLLRGFSMCVFGCRLQTKFIKAVALFLPRVYFILLAHVFTFTCEADKADLSGWKTLLCVWAGWDLHQLDGLILSLLPVDSCVCSLKELWQYSLFCCGHSNSFGYRLLWYAFAAGVQGCMVLLADKAISLRRNSFFSHQHH